MLNNDAIEAIRFKVLYEDSQIVFDPEKHRYFWDECEWPSVSKLLRPITDEELAAIPREVLEAARQRGTSIHTAIDEYLATGFDLSVGETAAMMKQFKRFMAEHRVVVIAHEVKLRHVGYGYAGRADMLAVLGDEDVIRPIDYKATYEINTSVALQLHMYEMSLISYNLPVAEGRVLWLKPDRYELVPASLIAPKTTYEATCRGLITVNSWKTQFSKKRRSA